MNHPDIITISAERREEIEAERAALRVTISGASLVTDRAAQNKAREIRDLAAALLPLGISEAQIRLQSVRLENVGGAILKSSSATYVLKISGVSVEILGDVLGALAAQKNLTMNAISWRYPTEEATRERVLDECVQEAKAKAQRLARLLGVRLLGVYEMSDLSNFDSMMDTLTLSSEPQMARARHQMTAEDFGIALSHSKEVRCQITIGFRVSEMQKEVSDDDGINS